MTTLKEPTQIEMLVKALVARMAVDAEAFNANITKVPVPTTPQVLSDSRLKWFNIAIGEELQEINNACMDGDVLEAADGLLDLTFFALGRLGEMGIPALAIWEAITKANLEKEQGSLDKRPGSMGHDAVKPLGWTPPNHDWLLTFSLSDVEKVRQFKELSPVFQRITQLRASKGSDYNNVPGGRDAYFPYGHASYAHMVNTKSLRVQSLVTSMLSSGKAPNFEGLKDSVDDLINYSAFYAEAMADGRLEVPV